MDLYCHGLSAVSYSTVGGWLPSSTLYGSHSSSPLPGHCCLVCATACRLWNYRVLLHFTNSKLATARNSPAALHSLASGFSVNRACRLLLYSTPGRPLTAPTKAEVCPQSPDKHKRSKQVTVLYLLPSSSLCVHLS